MIVGFAVHADRTGGDDVPATREKVVAAGEATSGLVDRHSPGSVVSAET